jgi:hypothetical protein
LVGIVGYDPTAFCLRGGCSVRLSYIPGLVLADWVEHNHRTVINRLLSAVELCQVEWWVTDGIEPHADQGAGFTARCWHQPTIATLEIWYPRFDSNEHCRRSERRDSCRLVYAGMARAVGVELTLDRLSTCCLCHWATRAIWFRAQGSNLDLSAFKAQRPRRQLARIKMAAPEGFEPPAFRVQSAAAGPTS